MSIISRIKSLLAANANAALDAVENPDVMIDQYIREAESNLGEVKAHTADAMVIAGKCQKKVDAINAEIAALEGYAKKALEAGNEEDSVKFLEKKVSLEAELPELEASLASANATVENLRGVHDKLQSEVDGYRLKRDTLKSKVSIMKANEAATKVLDSGRYTSTAVNFSRIEERIDNMIAKQDALATLNSGKKNEVSELKAKYGSAEHDAAVQAELAKLKASINKKS